MNASTLMGVARHIVAAGAPALPTFVLVRDLPLFEVELAALELAEEAKLAASDWAVLALTRALGEVSPVDVDAYLGLGATVGDAIVHRLVEDGLLEERREPDPAAAPTPAEETGIGAFFRRLLGVKSEIAAATAPVPLRRPTIAHRLRDSAAPDTPTCVLSTAGEVALDRGAVVRRRVQPARTLFWAEPLHYLDTIDERRHRYSQHWRPRPLEPERVPASFRTLDAVLALPPDERATACGIKDGLRGLPGRLVGVVPGAQWEVRPATRGRNARDAASGEGPEQQMASLIFAAFPSTDVERLRFRAYTRSQERLADNPHLDPRRILDEGARALSALLGVVAGAAGVEVRESALRADGAFTIACQAPAIRDFLGEEDRPADVYLTRTGPNGWLVGARVHVVPADAEAARVAFFEYLRRRDAELRRSFDATCLVVAEILRAHWGAPHPLPTPDEVAHALWNRPELRAALCMRRLHGDLVEPYAPATEVR